MAIASLVRKIPDSLQRACYRITHWETWNWFVKYIPMIPVWIWYCIRARSIWFFTACNPTLTFGGFEGENKREMYAQLPVGTFPATLYISPSSDFRDLLQRVHHANLKFPLAVKPDIGRMGLMFRKIDTAEQLHEYHQRMPCDYIVQEFIDYPIEVSVFYYRFPGRQQGTITGFVRKDCLSITGDGRSTLWELMCKYDRVRFRLNEMKIKHASSLDVVIPEGEVFILSHALNLSRGGKLVSLEHEKDERLLSLFDDISHHNGSFYFGRYDVRCRSIEDLKNRKNFSILEFNGAGAEAHHCYGNGYNLFEAISILLFHWKILFEISMANHKHGIRFWTFREGIEHLRKSKAHFALINKLESASQPTEKQDGAQPNRELSWYERTRFGEA